MTPEDKKWVEESKEIYGETNPFIKFFSIIEKQERMIEYLKSKVTDWDYCPCPDCIEKVLVELEEMEK